MSSSTGPFLYPNVSSIPKQPTDVSGSNSSQKKSEAPGEFQKVFEKTLSESQSQDLKEIKPALKFSAHATQRLQDRKIALEPKTLAAVREAVDKAEAKGIGETLVLTKDAALIVNVKNRTVVTAMDRESLVGNVFTNIDGAVIV